VAAEQRRLELGLTAHCELDLRGANDAVAVVASIAIGGGEQHVGEESEQPR
jgi:hypothetical protein